ncbi:tRNA nucleotidyltransferase/poly(A) polymerase [Trachipleistophora hominis]|uniref:tRNA nucleotidyltransferase/poly(A) polymerase n=1 Tax=Trachipleistophora hominis TaxID=72359 RepID=L7JZP1_TRAHO|nr:tRNA nucleotidyltransferase/poly(A) polymerase [Trachipleistophora hominis]
MSLHEIRLTPTEEKILTKIKTYAHTLQGIVPRIAGGWVRDKLLGKLSNDIDITINRISGYAFASGMQKYYGMTGSVGQIKANPEKSKHLETAVMRIEGVFVDFLSLRTEEYFDTRIPVVKSCSAQEDAFRRDLTINSLFYNIVEQRVEDFTGKGLSDLEQGVIRTPMEPLKTLIDDPLRILRVIRFSVRFRFKIADDLFMAFQNEHVRTNLHKKISNERIGQEMYKILGYEHFIHAFKVITQCELVPAIFKKHIPIDQHILMHGYDNYMRLQKYFVFDERIARLYIILLHNACVSVENTFSNFLIVKNYLCYGKKDFTRVKVIEKNLCLLRKVNERMSAEDAVFLVRHMKEEYELSFFVYLMVADYEHDDLERNFYGIIDESVGDEEERGVNNCEIIDKTEKNTKNEQPLTIEKRRTEQSDEIIANREYVKGNQTTEYGEKTFSCKHESKETIGKCEYSSDARAEGSLTMEMMNLHIPGNSTSDARAEGSLTTEMMNLHIHTSNDMKAADLSYSDHSSMNADNDTTRAHPLPADRSSAGTAHESLKQCANKNKHLILHILRTIRPYKTRLFSTTFTFNGRTIFDTLGIDQNETSFYLEMAKVQQIVHGVADDDIMDRMKVIKEQQRIKGFRAFYLTNIF